MKKPGITKGKWRKTNTVKVNLDGEKYQALDIGAEKFIAVVYGKSKEKAIENGRLICKAGNLTNEGFDISVMPELYDLLDRVLGSFSLERTENFELIEKIKESLKKAKFGEL